MNSSQPLVSVITVVKDDYEGLKRTLGSLDRVAIESLEVLVVDGTSEGVFSIPRGYIKNSLKVGINFLKPQGIYNAMNTGARDVNGEWLWFLNAGDYCVASDLQFHGFMNDLSKMNSEIVAVVSPVAITTKSGNLYDIAIPNLLEDELHCNHQGVFIRRSAYLAIGGFDETLKMAADGKFLDALVKLGKIESINFVVTSFVMGGRSAQNFLTTLEEISSYRKNLSSKNKKNILILKTQLRNKFLTTGFLKLAVTKFLLNLREEKIRRKYNNSIVLPSKEKFRQ